MPRLFICSLVSLGLFLGVGVEEVAVVDVEKDPEAEAMDQELGTDALIDEIGGDGGLGDIELKA